MYVISRRPTKGRLEYWGNMRNERPCLKSLYKYLYKRYSDKESNGFTYDIQKVSLIRKWVSPLFCPEALSHWYINEFTSGFASLNYVFDAYLSEDKATKAAEYFNTLLKECFIYDTEFSLEAQPWIWFHECGYNSNLLKGTPINVEYSFVLMPSSLGHAIEGVTVKESIANTWYSNPGIHFLDAGGGRFCRQRLGIFVGRVADSIRLRHSIVSGVVLSLMVTLLPWIVSLGSSLGSSLFSYMWVVIPAFFNEFINIVKCI